jgi:asparagine synthase (glutamine-hydrolysing)
MCGIAGVLYADPHRPVDPLVLKRMGDSLAHRGPDAEGFWSEPGVGLIHRRLSIIDLAGGDQPIANEDGSLEIVCNGEIYNYHALRAGLLERGHRLSTQGDIETILHLYEEDDHSFVEKLRGMYAFGLWDRKRRRLVLGRDRVGIKPLYVYRDAEKLIFGSEMKALLAHPDVARDLDPAAVEEYLAYGMVPGTRSIFRRVEKLLPAHVLYVDQASFQRSTSRRYWQLQFQPDGTQSEANWQEALTAKIEEAVKLHMIADVPVGAFLSGGLDSSIIVATASRMTSEPLQTFSIGFQEESFSELPFAREVALRYDTRQVEEIVTPDAASLLDDLTQFYDEPFADPSAIPTYLVSRLARRSVKVALSGDGGDEAFGGYARYAHDLQEAAMRSRLPVWFRRRAIAPLARIWPKADWLPRPLRAKTRLTNLAADADAAYANTLTLCRQPLRRRLLAGALAGRLNGHQPEEVVRGAFSQDPAADPLAAMTAADVATLLPDDFLVKVDRASMAHGLEVRPPLLDHELLELAARIPSSLKIRASETKWILKRTYERQLPPSIVWRKKHGFDMPIDGWLRGPLRDAFDAAVLEPSSPVRDLIDQPTARGLMRAHRTGTGQHGSVLWSLLILARWAERYLPARSLGQLVAPVLASVR